MRKMAYAILTVHANGVDGDFDGFTFEGATWEWVMKLDFIHHERVLVRVR